ncbi:MAG: hypothetical protein A2589_03600 [Candidatus Vogelbacteria bacterium RIFOXYD1_FULL_46_19]|uniref:Uncharacterized protein n=1 Tax=Candidatus Vogelbacteria bacterium RIFOXYD1_FULL_46_19 TaxID=1802439 RepID=A0A1G2QH94_9BACT|nr:MAG: hypothetical protein A2589_03600 [Candidatus Vogelbacteria bacterium RIFOXYD1_FULL_46_19]
MDVTTLLAQIWGPVILAIGLGVLVSRSYYLKIYRDLEKETLAMLIFAMVAIAVGIIHIRIHNVWGNLSEILISFLGWALLAKGLMFAIAPKFVNRAGDWAVKAKAVPVAGIVMLIIGAYLSWVGYLG